MSEVAVEPGDVLDARRLAGPAERQVADADDRHPGPVNGSPTAVEQGISRRMARPYGQLANRRPSRAVAASGPRRSPRTRASQSSSTVFLPPRRSIFAGAESSPARLEVSIAVNGAVERTGAWAFPAQSGQGCQGRQVLHTWDWHPCWSKTDHHGCYGCVGMATGWESWNREGQCLVGQTALYFQSKIGKKWGYGVLSRASCH